MIDPFCFPIFLEFASDIDEAQADIESCFRRADKLFDRLCDRLHIDRDGEIADVLYERIFNK